MKHKLETQDPKAADEIRDGWEVLRTGVNTILLSGLRSECHSFEDDESQDSHFNCTKYLRDVNPKTIFKIYTV